MANPSQHQVYLAYNAVVLRSLLLQLLRRSYYGGHYPVQAPVAASYQLATLYIDDLLSPPLPLVYRYTRGSRFLLLPFLLFLACAVEATKAHALGVLVEFLLGFVSANGDLLGLVAWLHVQIIRRF